MVTSEIGKPHPKQNQIVPMKLPAEEQVGCLNPVVTSDPDKWLSKSAIDFGGLKQNPAYEPSHLFHPISNLSPDSVNTTNRDRL